MGLLIDVWVGWTVRLKRKEGKTSEWKWDWVQSFVYPLVQGHDSSLTAEDSLFGATQKKKKDAKAESSRGFGIVTSFGLSYLRPNLILYSTHLEFGDKKK